MKMYSIHSFIQLFMFLFTHFRYESPSLVFFVFIHSFIHPFIHLFILFVSREEPIDYGELDTSLRKTCDKLGVKDVDGEHVGGSIPVKVTLDISRSPIDFQWGSWKYPG